MQVEVISKKTVNLEEYWVIRGIKKLNGKYEALIEKEMCVEPNALAVAQFLVEHPICDFASVEHNYRIKPDYNVSMDEDYFAELKRTVDVLKREDYE